MARKYIFVVLTCLVGLAVQAQAKQNRKPADNPKEPTRFMIVGKDAESLFKYLESHVSLENGSVTANTEGPAFTGNTEKFFKIVSLKPGIFCKHVIVWKIGDREKPLSDDYVCYTEK